MVPSPASKEFFDAERLEPTHMPGGWRPPGTRNQAIQGYPFALGLTPEQKTGSPRVPAKLVGSCLIRQPAGWTALPISTTLYTCFPTNNRDRNRSRSCELSVVR